jgi:hypothetical protein
MEAEVNALTGEVDEALWNRVSLFASTHELSAGTGFNLSKLENTTLFSKSYPMVRDTSVPVFPFTIETCYWTNR